MVIKKNIFVVVGYIHIFKDIGVALRSHFIANPEKYGAVAPHVIDLRAWVFKDDVAREISELEKRLAIMDRQDGRKGAIIIPTANPWVVDAALADVHVRGRQTVSEADFFKITTELWSRILCVQPDGSVVRMTDQQRHLFDYFLNLGTTVSPGPATKTPGYYIADILQYVGFWPTQAIDAKQIDACNEVRNESV